MSTSIATHTLFDPNLIGADDRQEEVASTRQRFVEPKNAAPNDTASWMPGSDLAKTSRLGKGGAFALTMFAHVVFFALLANLRSAPTDGPFQPTQVVIVAEQQDQLEIPEPPKPKIETPEFDVPLVPVVIDTFDPNSNSITVVQRPSEAAPVSVASTGAPKEVSSVEYVREPAAKYPASARALKQRGTVTLRALVDSDGHAREVNVHRSSGHKTLDDAARLAVFNALFKPYREDGRFIPVYVLIPIEFGAKG